MLLVISLLLLSPKLILLAAQQANKSRDEVLGQGVAMLPGASPCARGTVRPNNTKTSEFGAEKVYCRAMQGDRWLMPKKNPKLPEGFQKAFLKVRWGKSMVTCCRLLGDGSFVLAAVHLSQVTMFL